MQDWMLGGITLFSGLSLRRFCLGVGVLPPGITALCTIIVRGTPRAIIIIIKRIHNTSFRCRDRSILTSSTVVTLPRHHADLLYCIKFVRRIATARSWWDALGRRWNFDQRGPA